jgi:hypothetical protein
MPVPIFSVNPVGCSAWLSPAAWANICAWSTSVAHLQLISVVVLWGVLKEEEDHPKVSHDQKRWLARALHSPDFFKQISFLAILVIIVIVVSILIYD